MSEITCENFFAELPTIEAVIKESAFVCFDMEFSKLHENISNPLTYFDSDEERYCKLREKVSDITCLQLGLSIFCHDTNNRSFKAYSYSFFTYPQTCYKSDSVVNFQTSCVEFLCKHNFDFNKLFYNRVPYLTDDQESAIQLEMMDALFFDKYFKTNSNFRSIEEELHKVSNNVFEWYDNANYEETTFLEINGCNEPAYSILMQYYLLKKFNSISINENQNGLTITKKESPESPSNQIIENLKLSLLQKMLGVKYVLKLISKLKKPLIGHNCALDMLILCNQFFKPLPESFEDYKHFMHNNFGLIYDTKLLCKEVKLMKPKDSEWFGNSLTQIYSYLKYEDGKEFLSNYITIKSANVEEYQNMKFHHAGWDAYYTGYCFVQMSKIIKDNSCKKSNLYPPRYTLAELFKSVDFFKNKFHTYRSVSNCINLSSTNYQNRTDCYLIIQNKSIFYKKLNLNKLIIDMKNICKSFDVKLLSNYTALIAVSTNSLSKNIRARILSRETNCNYIVNNFPSKYKVEYYSQYQKKISIQQMIGFSLGLIASSVAVIAYVKKQ